LPKYQELINPLLRVLSQAGKPLSNTEIEAGVIAELNMPHVLYSMIHSGKRTQLQYRLGWARTKAKSLGYINSPARETWTITDLGKNHCKFLNFWGEFSTFIH
jgi:restriction endonuclease Mrr